jgi:ankyrin repeat protein
MGLFGFSKHKTLTDAVRAGDVRAVRKMLNQGADPNRCEPKNSYPIHYALHDGPEMVQLLVDHGADVNIPSPSNHTMPLAFAESEGYTDVAAVLRKAGARLRTGEEELSLDPRIRLWIEPKIRSLVFDIRMHFLTSKATPEMIAELVDEKLNIEFPATMSPQDRERTRKDVRALIKKECGVKDYLK